MSSSSSALTITITDLEITSFWFGSSSSDPTSTSLMQLTVKSKDNPSFYGLVDLWQVMQLELMLFDTTENSYTNEKLARAAHATRTPIVLDGLVEWSSVGLEKIENCCLILTIEYAPDTKKRLDRLDNMKAELSYCRPIVL